MGRFTNMAYLFAYFTSGNGEEKVYKVRELCPYPFDESDLNA